MHLSLRSPLAFALKLWVEKTFAQALDRWSLKDRLAGTANYGPRAFFYGNVECMVNCITCYAVPGTAEVVLSTLSKIGTGRLLNLGGGPHTSRLYEALGFSVTSIDLEQPLSDKDIQFDLNSTKELPISLGGFRVVVAQEIIEHLENPWQLFRRAASALAPGGVLIVTTPNILSEKSFRSVKQHQHFHWFTPDCFSYHVNPIPYFELELIASRTGFSMVESYGNNSFFIEGETKSKRLRKSECLIYVFRRAG